MNRNISRVRVYKYFYVLNIGTEMFTWHMKKFRSSRVKNRKAPIIYAVILLNGKNRYI